MFIDAEFYFIFSEKSNTRIFNPYIFVIIVKIFIYFI